MKNRSVDYTNGTLLDCGPLKLYSNIIVNPSLAQTKDNGIFLSEQDSIALLEGMRPVLGIIRPSKGVGYL